VSDSAKGEERERPAGLLASSRRLLASLLEMVQTRLEIVSGEFEEERERLQELVVYGLVSLWLISFGVIFLTLLVVVLLWEEHRYAALGAFAALYLGLGAYVLAMLRRKLRERSRLFAATIAELKKDRQSLTPPT
jgi:uncharacterized membrane protein YqjE